MSHSQPESSDMSSCPTCPTCPMSYVLCVLSHASTPTVYFSLAKGCVLRLRQERGPQIDWGFFNRRLIFVPRPWNRNHNLLDELIHCFFLFFVRKIVMSCPKIYVIYFEPVLRSNPILIPSTFFQKKWLSSSFYSLRRDTKHTQTGSTVKEKKKS